MERALALATTASWRSSHRFDEVGGRRYWQQLRGGRLLRQVPARAGLAGDSARACVGTSRTYFRSSRCARSSVGASDRARHMSFGMVQRCRGESPHIWRAQARGAVRCEHLLHDNRWTTIGGGLRFGCRSAGGVETPLAVADVHQRLALPHVPDPRLVDSLPLRRPARSSSPRFPGPYGHDAFLLESQEQTRYVEPFLGARAVEARRDAGVPQEGDEQ